MITIYKNQLSSESSTVKFNYELKGIKLSGFVIFYQGNFHVYQNQCMHLSVELDWQDNDFFDDEGRFIVCATHGAIYNPVELTIVPSQSNIITLYFLLISMHQFY